MRKIHSDNKMVEILDMQLSPFHLFGGDLEDLHGPHFIVDRDFNGVWRKPATARGAWERNNECE